jgi:predicted oxidoreductase (fatty acid repression mutant protein)
VLTSSIIIRELHRGLWRSSKFNLCNWRVGELVLPFVHLLTDGCACSNVPETWKLKAQLVFGEPTAGPGPEKERTFLDVALKVYGGDEKAE